MDLLSYSELVNIKGNSYIKYADLLLTKEWKEKREEIISRENNCCQICHERCMDYLMLTARNNCVKHVPAIVEFVEEDYLHRGTLVKKDVLKLVEMKNPKIANIHHTYYILKKLPWEYQNDSLMLLCHDCHKNLHCSQEIKVYRDESKIGFSESLNCPKCFGTGHLHEYNYWFNGICFECDGKGFY